MRFSWGFIQFQGQSLINLLRHIQTTRPALFTRYFEQYGLTLAEPGRTPAPNRRRRERTVPGEDRGRPNTEARGVNELLVYDHESHEWVAGNEALHVIQGDPRYQSLFVAAGDDPGIQVAQMERAIISYCVPMRQLQVRFRRARQTLPVNQFVNSEVVMFALISRAVGGGTGFVSGMFNQFVNANDIAPEDIINHQQELSDFVRGYRANGVDIQWQRAENLPPAGIEPLRSTVYEGSG